MCRDNELSFLLQNKYFEWKKKGCNKVHSSSKKRFLTSNLITCCNNGIIKPFTTEQQNIEIVSDTSFNKLWSTSWTSVYSLRMMIIFFHIYRAIIPTHSCIHGNFWQTFKKATARNSLWHETTQFSIRNLGRETHNSSVESVLDGVTCLCMSRHSGSIILLGL